jgi:hypothetical protein
LVTEEESFFPLALRVLGPEHWAEIDAQVTDREDSLFGGAGEERFHALHEIILELERAGGKSPTRVRPSPPPRRAPPVGWGNRMRSAAADLRHTFSYFQ